MPSYCICRVSHNIFSGMFNYSPRWPKLSTGIGVQKTAMVFSKPEQVYEKIFSMGGGMYSCSAVALEFNRGMGSSVCKKTFIIISQRSLVLSKSMDMEH